ncbi:fibronectin type III domain protein [Beggiatoa sp. SS]|nr:fibronectin type III domain protein [Beggiatoa sp. SS]
MTQSSAGYYICFSVIPHANAGLPDGDEVTAVSSGQLPKLSQSITFGALTDKSYGDSSFTVGATTDSGLFVSYSTSGNCSNSGSSVSLTGAGSCTVTASQSGNASFEAASSKSQTFSIAKGQAFINFNPPNSKTYGDPPFSISASGDSSKPVTLSGSNSVCSYSGGQVTIFEAGTCYVTARQEGDSNYEAATPVQRSILIRRQPQTINFPVSRLKNILMSLLTCQQLVAFQATRLF